LLELGVALHKSAVASPCEQRTSALRELLPRFYRAMSGEFASRDTEEVRKEVTDTLVELAGSPRRSATIRAIRYVLTIHQAVWPEGLPWLNDTQLPADALSQALAALDSDDCRETLQALPQSNTDAERDEMQAELGRARQRLREPGRPIVAQGSVAAADTGGVNNKATDGPSFKSDNSTARAEDGQPDHIEPEPTTEPLPRKKSKRSTERGEGRDKLVAALTKHHKYAEGGCLNQEPIGNNALARLAEVSESTASEFFKSEFKGHRKYRAACGNAQRLITALKVLNQEFSPHHVLEHEPATEFPQEDEE
jgi:hypothetical protein